MAWPWYTPSNSWEARGQQIAEQQAAARRRSVPNLFAPSNMVRGDRYTGSSNSVSRELPVSSRYASPQRTSSSSSRSSNNDHHDDNHDDRRSTPVSRPKLFPATTSTAPEPLDNFRPQFRPEASKPGTVRKFSGNGYVSNGQYGNGKGDYGLEGTYGTGIENRDMGIVNKMLGINTALAAETPTNAFNQQSYVQSQPVSSFGDFRDTTDPAPGVTDPSLYEMQNGTPKWKEYDYVGSGDYQAWNEYLDAQKAYNDSQNAAAYGGGGQMQAAPMDSGYNKQIKSQEKYFKEAEKAQKKALEELLKSIEAQYSQDVTAGTSELEKAKQEDLLRLSGLFAFANQDPNSEQRIQYQNRLSGDYSNRLAELLRQLGADRTQNVLKARQGAQDSYSRIAEARANAQQGIMQLLMQAQADAAKRGRSYAPSNYDPYMTGGSLEEGLF